MDSRQKIMTRVICMPSAYVYLCVVVVIDSDCPESQMRILSSACHLPPLVCCEGTNLNWVRSKLVRGVGQVIAWIKSNNIGHITLRPPFVGAVRPTNPPMLAIPNAPCVNRPRGLPS